MAYFILLNARQACPSECKLKGRYTQIQINTWNTPESSIFSTPPHQPQSSLIVSQDLSLEPLEMFINCRQSICLTGRAE